MPYYNMNAKEFQKLLTNEVATYKAFLESDNNDWIVKGFIDVNKTIYTISNDTKVVSKIIEILLIPKLEKFAADNGLLLELPSKQNFYPDLTFKDSKGHLFAVDFKTSYYQGNHFNGLTLGSYWGYFRNRTKAMNTDHPYGEYKCHLVIGILYKQSSDEIDEKRTYQVDEIGQIKSVIENFVFFVQPKWKIASDLPGSGNTRNIGGITDIRKLQAGEGPFASLGEDVFDDYWSNYYNKTDAQQVGIGKPKYTNIATYKQYLEQQKKILGKL